MTSYDYLSIHLPTHTHRPLGIWYFHFCNTVISHNNNLNLVVYNIFVQILENFNSVSFSFFEMQNFKEDLDKCLIRVPHFAWYLTKSVVVQRVQCCWCCNGVRMIVMMISVLMVDNFTNDVATRMSVINLHVGQDWNINYLQGHHQTDQYKGMYPKPNPQ